MGSASDQGCNTRASVGCNDRGLMEARDLHRTVQAQRQADAAAVDRAEFQRVLGEARRQDAETRRLVRLSRAFLRMCGGYANHLLRCQVQ